jgi:hypothetical protein
LHRIFTWLFLFWVIVCFCFLFGLCLLIVLTSLNPVPNAQVCVYLTVHITKLQLQTTFSKPLYISHSACIHQDPGHWKSWCLHCLWPVRSNIQLILISKSWGCPPPGPGMSFLDSYTCAEGGIYLFLPRFFSLHDAIHGWMTGRIDDGWVTWWKKLQEKGSWRPLLYVICLVLLMNGFPSLILIYKVFFLFLKSKMCFHFDYILCLIDLCNLWVYLHGKS